MGDSFCSKQNLNLAYQRLLGICRFGKLQGSKHCSIFIAMVAFFIYLPLSMAGTHFSVEGSLSENNLQLNTQKSRSISGSVATDLGKYFRIGVTHRQTRTEREGYSQINNTNYYYYSIEMMHLHSNSIDLTIILYNGDVFVPYLNLGILKKDYVIESTLGDGLFQKNTVSLDPVPNAGAGIGIRVDKHLSIKISYSISPGVKTSLTDMTDSDVFDTFTSLGISYTI